MVSDLGYDGERELNRSGKELGMTRMWVMKEKEVSNMTVSSFVL